MKIILTTVRHDDDDDGEYHYYYDGIYFRNPATLNLQNF